MPTNANGYNSRVTDEALEKRFRDTFRSQGGSELVDDLYAQGVIVPIVDFTGAATGDVLAQNLQTAWDFSTDATQINNATTTLITNTGFWQVDLTVLDTDAGGGSVAPVARIYLDDGSTEKTVWAISSALPTGTREFVNLAEGKFVVFLRSGDSLVGRSYNTEVTLDVWYRQIADVNGNLINPLGFTSS